MIFSNIVGSFLRWKGIHIYLESTKNINNLKFELVGDFGVDEDYNKYIKSLLQKNIVLKGFIQDIKNYYEKIDVVVHTSIEADPLPTILIEGLAKGKVLIGSDVGGVREIIDDSYGNIIVPPNDANALKEAILKVSKYSMETLEDIKQKNIKRAKDLFLLEKQVKKMENIYLEVYKDV